MPFGEVARPPWHTMLPTSASFEFTGDLRLL